MVMQRLKFSESSSGDPFYRGLRSRVHASLDHLGTDLYFWLKALFFFVMCWGTYSLILLGVLQGWCAFLGAIVVAIAGLLVGFSVGHDASHRVISRHEWVNKALHFISFLSVGVDPMLWGLRHIRSHHIYPNVHGSDIDIDKNPLLRLSPDHPWRSMHRYQHLYAPLAYCLALIHSICWGDWVYLLAREYRWMREGVSPCGLWMSFFLFKILHLGLMLVLPLLVLEYSSFAIVATYLITGCIASLIFIVMLVGTHFFDAAAFPRPSSDSCLPNTWVRHNLETSCDWDPTSPFARFISGGANCHAAHHLFPNICHTHYGKIAAMIS
ncbi:MAG: acyl-CoA desaturase, partial [Proteobacteria bacterium]|nr:acyl-CoA desaturase [Pseudomonadota bacterium]